MRKLTLIALLMILTVSGAAFAQTATTPVFCGTLPEADCVILAQSQTAMQTLDSASFELQIDLSVTDIPDFSTPITLSMTGNGAYGGLGAVNQAMLSNVGDLGAMLTDLFTELKFDGTITLSFSPEIASMANLPTSITLQERLVDGTVYLNMDTLSGLMGNARLRGWYGLDLAGLVDAAMRQMPEMFNGSMGSTGAMQDYQQTLLDSDFLNSFMSIERTDDGSGDTATFATTINMTALMKSPGFSDLMKAQMQMQGNTMTEAEMGQAMAMASQMFKGMSMSLEQEIGLGDGYIRRASGSFSFDTTGMMNAINSMSKTKTNQTVAPQIDLTFSYGYSDFNDAPAITAPENPTIIPYQSLIGSSVSA